MLSTFEDQSIWLTPHPKLEGISMMAHLFNRMNGTYPNKWRINFRDNQAIEDWELAWAEAFDDEGITPQDVALGIKNCRRMYEWPPSLPEFLKACRPNLIPDVAFFEAVRGMQARSGQEQIGEWSHPAIFHAAVMIGQHDMLNLSYQQLKIRWEKALSEQLALGQWPDIPEVTKLLPVYVDTEKGAKQVRKVGDLIAKAASNEGKDHKRWAKRILENPAGKSSAVIRKAEIALGVEVAR